MNKSKLACLIVCITLSLAVFGGLIDQQVAAKSKEASNLPLISLEQAFPAEEKIELTTAFPVLSGTATALFDFEVELNYVGGEESRYFELSTKAPGGWSTFIQKSAYGELPKQISAIRLDPEAGYPERVTVRASVLPWASVEPGDYTIRLEVAESTSGKPKNSIDLTARITARYEFWVGTATGRLNIKVEAGEDSYLPITIANTGSTVLDEIKFSSSKPEEWRIIFEPERIESLSPGDTEEVSVAIKPPSKTIAGDYMVTLKFDSEPRPSETKLPELYIRVTVSTPTHWGWIAVGIVVAVIAGLAVTFSRLGRR